MNNRYSTMVMADLLRALAVCAVVWGGAWLLHVVWP